MGRKSSAEEGPVHSPIGRHDANETENTTKQGNTKEPNQTKQSKQNSNQNKTNKNIAKWHRAIQHGCKRKWLCILNRIGMAKWNQKTGKNETAQTNSPYETCERSNTALCGNQGSPQPGAPRSHRASLTGINSHKSWVDLGLAMTQSRSQRKGETKGETGLWWEVKDALLPLRIRSESTQ